MRLASISAGLAASSAIAAAICSRRASSSTIWPSASASRLLQPAWSWAIWPRRSTRIAASRARRSQLPSASTSAARSSAMRALSTPALTRSAWVSEIDDRRAWRKVRRISASAMSPTISATACSMPAEPRAQLIGAAGHFGVPVACLGGGVLGSRDGGLRRAFGGTGCFAGILALAPRRLGHRALMRAGLLDGGLLGLAGRRQRRPLRPRPRPGPPHVRLASPSICWRISASRLRWLSRTAAVDGAPARMV